MFWVVRIRWVNWLALVSLIWQLHVSGRIMSVSLYRYLPLLLVIMRWFPQVFALTIWRRNAFTRSQLGSVLLGVDQRTMWQACWYANNRRMDVFGEIHANLMQPRNVDILDKINWLVWLLMRNVDSWMENVSALLPLFFCNVMEVWIGWHALSWLIQVRFVNSVVHAWIWGWLQRWDVGTYWMWILMLVERLRVNGVTMIRPVEIVSQLLGMRLVLRVDWISLGVCLPRIVLVNGTLHPVLVLNLRWVGGLNVPPWNWWMLWPVVMLLIEQIIQINYAVTIQYLTLAESWLWLP